MNRTAAASLGVSLVAFVGYGLTLCPTIFVGDSGELAWAAASLGIAHPPGFPLWTLLGRVAVLALPGTPAFSLNLLSALTAAGTAGLLAALLARLTGRVAVSAGVAVAFAFSRNVWPVAVTTEVYALNLLVTVAALAAAFAARDGRPRLFLLAAYLLGLGTANHPFVLLAGPPVALLLLAAPDRAAAARRVPVMLGLFALGLSAYLYLPVRWSAGPEMNWGGIRSLPEIWDHVTRAQYGGLGEASAQTSFALRLRVFVDVLGRGVPWLLGIAAAAGLADLLRRGERLGAAALGGLLLLAGPVTAAVIRYEDTFLDESVVTVFFLPAVLAAFLLAGVGVAAVDRWVAARLAATGRAAAVTSGAVAVLLPVAVHQMNVAACDRSESTAVRVYAEAALEPLPPGARLYMLGDNTTFGLAYFQRVEGMRPDVVLMDRTLNLFVESYGADFPAMSRRERKARRDARELEIAFSEPDVPVFYSEWFDFTDFGGCRLAPRGVVNQLLRPGETAVPHVTQPVTLPPIDRSDFLESHLAGVTLYRQGLALAAEGRTHEALESYRAAAEHGERIAGLLRNLGLAHLELGDLTAAEERFLEAIELEPLNQDAMYNLAVLYSYSGRVAESIRWYERLGAQNPEYPEVYLNWSIELIRAGRLTEAGAVVERALALDPTLGPAVEVRDAVAGGLEIGGEEGVLEAQRVVDPLAVGGTLQLAGRYLERGDVRKAIELYREVAQKSPESVLAAHGLGYGLVRAGQFDEAAVAFRRLLELDPGSADGRNALAFIFAVTGDSLERAEELAEEALELDPRLSAYWYDTLGWVRYRRGRHEEALQALRLSEESLPPDDPSTRAENLYHIGAVLMALGRNDEAADYLARSVRRAKGEYWVPDLEARARELGIEEASL